MVLPEPVIQGLFDRGFQFYRWGPEAGSEADGEADREAKQELRLVAAFNTDPDHVEAFLTAARELS